jgi:hypothetical protein
VWRYDPDLGDGRRGWFAPLGPWVLGVVEHADGRVTWGVSGPDDDEDRDSDGVAPDVHLAKRAAAYEVRRRYARLGNVMQDLERG